MKIGSFVGGVSTGLNCLQQFVIGISFENTLCLKRSCLPGLKPFIILNSIVCSQLYFQFFLCLLQWQSENLRNFTTSKSNVLGNLAGEEIILIYILFCLTDMSRVPYLEPFVNNAIGNQWEVKYKQGNLEA